MFHRDPDVQTPWMALRCRPWGPDIGSLSVCLVLGLLSDLFLGQPSCNNRASGMLSGQRHVWPAHPSTFHRGWDTRGTAAVLRELTSELAGSSITSVTLWRGVGIRGGGWGRAPELCEARTFRSAEKSRWVVGCRAPSVL